MGFCFSTAASNFMRSASAAAVTRMRLASASERFFWRSSSALLSMILACAAASAFCRVASLRACASSLLCSMRFCFQLRDFHLLLLDLRLGAEPLVFLLLQQQPFESLGVFLREL